MRGEDYKIEMAPDVEAALAKDPKAQAMVREMNARMRQALDGVGTRFKDVDEALRSVGMVPLSEAEGDDAMTGQ
jgi:hypothetical protein